MEVYVYEEEEVSAEEEQEEDEQKLPRPGNIFVHHDVMLPDFALCEFYQLGAFLPTTRSRFFVCICRRFFVVSLLLGEISWSFNSHFKSSIPWNL